MADVTLSPHYIYTHLSRCILALLAKSRWMFHNYLTIKSTVMEQNQLSDFRNLNDELMEYSGGSTRSHKHAYTPRTFSAGVYYLRETFSCFWLIDKILLNSVRLPDSFQTWKLTRIINGQTRTENFILNCEDGDGGELYTENIHSSSFQGDLLELFIMNNILYLPCED
jgi:hypothetical protein